MSTRLKLEDLNIWQEAQALSRDIFEFTKQTLFIYDYGLIRQMRDSSGSIMDNIAKGFERDGNREFIQFLAISKDSCGELRSQITRSYDLEYIDGTPYHQFYQSAYTLSCRIDNFIKYLKPSNYRASSLMFHH